MRKDKWLDILSQWKKDLDGDPNVDHYDFNLQGRKSIIICYGDSWTRGGSLDEDLRLDQIYGHLISDHYSADWINVGCSGWSNSHIIQVAQVIANELIKDRSYQDIKMIFTLTENGRDVRTAKSFPFDYIDLYQQTGDANFLPTLLDSIEQSWHQQLDNLIRSADDRFDFFIGSNCAWHDRLFSAVFPRTVVSQDTWVDLLADAQSLPRPARARIVYAFAVEELLKSLDIAGVKDKSYSKSYAMNLMDLSISVNEWLSNSKLNHQEKMAKHATAKGHKIWARHIINCMEQQ